MRRSRFTEEQIIGILKEHEAEFVGLSQYVDSTMGADLLGIPHRQTGKPRTIGENQTNDRNGQETS
jgi:hypothetical protein